MKAIKKIRGRPKCSASTIASKFKKKDHSRIDPKHFGATMTERFLNKYVSCIFINSLKGKSIHTPILISLQISLQSATSTNDSARMLKKFLSQNQNFIQQVRSLILRQENWEDYFLDSVLGIKIKRPSDSKSELCEQLLGIITNYCQTLYCPKEKKKLEKNSQGTQISSLQSQNCKLSKDKLLKSMQDSERKQPPNEFL